ncbi:CPBP family intramembrane metalloprotease [Aerococcus sp. UMB1112A]|uniref:CPBP family intramembrane glutamic endopeptidase n=1 Tax=Aerococcus sp. UMB1112A TaxID=3050609 RepID=UPI00254F4A75|nr:CPBP family intramembrane metalloprotease [Aerococcus sp. UMB1112A]MDK8502631.1 CPBP family intramembrane metalloprotease [Aerococcus sp. UMB1112A]
MDKIKKWETIFLCFSLIALAGLGYIVANLISFYNELSHPVSLIILFLLGGLTFVLLPYKLMGHLLSDESGQTLKFRKVSYLVFMLGLIAIALIFEFDLADVMHAIIIASFEEFLFRYVIYTLLSYKFSHRSSLILTAFIFGFFLHLNGDFLTNALVRFPAGIVLQILCNRFGLEYSILLHALNNIIAGLV